MNPEKLCYNCFQDKEADGLCPHCGYDNSEEHPFLALPKGTILNGRYMTGRVLGVGGFGITYLGYDLVLQIRVAIKEYMPSGMATRYKDGYTVTLTGHLEKEYNAGMERFLDEVRILAKLQNQPNIVSAQNYFKENGTAYFVMEYIEGMSLKQYLKDHGEKISCEEALSILLPIMEALCVVHSMSLIHRDISPDNIYLTASGESRLLDFGAARFSMGDNKSVSVILKHGYAPEEQYSSRGNQGPWTDVYGMGATIYRCVTGLLPPDSIERMHNDTLRKPSDMGVAIPAPMEAAVLKALSVKAEDRFPNMQAFIDAIGGQPAHAAAHAATRPMTEPTVALPQRPEELSSPSGRRAFYQALRQADPVTRRRLIIGGVVGVAALALLFSLPSLLGGKSRSYSGGGGGGSAIGSSEITLPQLPSGSDEEQAPDTPTSGATTPDTSTSGASTPDATASGGTTAAGNLACHELVGYGAQISLPADWVEDPDLYLYTSPDSLMSLSVDYYYYTSFAPCYTLDDIANHVEDAAALMADAMGLSPYEVASSGATTLNGMPAYQIDLSAISPNNTLVDVVLLFTQPQNGFGLYFVTGSCDGNTAGAYDTLLQYLNTFTVTGPVDTEYQLFTSSALDFRFVYPGNSIPQTPIVKPLTMNGAQLSIALLYPDAGDTTQFLELENITPVASTRDGAVTYYRSLYQSVGAQLEDPYQDVWGGVEWTIWEGTLNQQSIACGIAEMNGQVYLAALAATDAYWDTLADCMACAMSTMRPTP